MRSYKLINVYTKYIIGTYFCNYIHYGTALNPDFYPSPAACRGGTTSRVAAAAYYFNACLLFHFQEGRSTVEKKYVRYIFNV